MEKNKIMSPALTVDDVQSISVDFLGEKLTPKEIAILKSRLDDDPPNWWGIIVGHLEIMFPE